jgi:hypothetical protein
MTFQGNNIWMYSSTRNADDIADVQVLIHEQSMVTFLQG